MWLISLTGLFLLANVCSGDEETDGENLLQAILDSLQKEQTSEYKSTPTTAYLPKTSTADMTSRSSSDSGVFPSRMLNSMGGPDNTTKTNLENNTTRFPFSTRASLFPSSSPSTFSRMLNPFSSTTMSESRTTSTLISKTTTLKFSTWSSTPDTGQDCATKDIFQSLCTADLPSLVKIANIWDVYYMLFSNYVINELLLNCASGEWCIRDEFDIFRAKMAEQADMVLNSAMFSETCDEVSLDCLESVVQNFQSCSFARRLNFTMECVRLMCSVRKMTSLSLQCTSQILTALHVTMIDILRKENKKQDLNVLFENDTCHTTKALMAKTYLCTCSKCSDDVITLLVRFTPWAWFLNDVVTLKTKCQLENDTCVSRDMVFMIDDGAVPIPTPPMTQIYRSSESGFVDIQSNPVAIAGIGTGAFVMMIGLVVFIVIFVKRRGTTQNQGYKPLETNEP